MTTHEELIAWYAEPGIFTTTSGFETLIDAIPDDIASVAAAVQGLLLHEAWAPAYRVSLSPERGAERQIHSAEAMLAVAVSRGASDLRVPLKPEQRVVGVCRHFATLFVAILRRKGIPARARCGFASYFEPGKNGDHWVGEYWNASRQRWVLVDEQLDALQRAIVKPDFDVLDVPRGRFLVAGDAWRLCRSGAADPMTFGVGGTDLWGLVEVLGDVFQDLAALQKIELLPWGWYGLAKDEANREKELELVDQLAAISSLADAVSFDRLRAMLDDDERLRVPPETITAHVAADRAAIATAA